MDCYIIRNAYDNKPVFTDISIKDALTHPLIMNKEDLPQWLFLDGINGDGLRRQINYANLNAIIIEYDGTLSIQDFIDNNADLSYALHTTSSHTLDKHKYRVILPLSEKIEYSVFKQREVVMAMMKKFPGIDKSCFSNWQKLPAMPMINKHYFCKFNKGDKFNLNMIEKEIKFARLANNYMSPVLPFNKRKVDNIDEEYIKAKSYAERLINTLPSGKTGDRYTSYCSAMGAIINLKYKDGQYVFGIDEIRSMFRTCYWDGLLDKALRSFIGMRKM